MRARFLSILSLFTISAAAEAQGSLIPRPCVMRPCPTDTRCFPCPPAPPTVLKQSSHVRAELADRVIRYEVTETFVNRGGGVGEADYIFPLPRGAAFQDLKLSINGELVSGETMNAAQARAIYVWNKKRTSVGGGAGAEDTAGTAAPPAELVQEIEHAEAPGTEAPAAR